MSTGNIRLIQQVREIEGMAGAHGMAYRQEELVTEVITEAAPLPKSQGLEAAALRPISATASVPKVQQMKRNADFLRKSDSLFQEAE